MVMKNIGNPYGNDNSILVDQVIGDAYKVVKHIEENLEVIKHVSDNLSTLEVLMNSLEAIQNIIANIDTLLLLEEAAPQLLVIYNNLNELLSLQTLVTNLDDLLEVKNNLTEILNAANIISEGIIEINASVVLAEQYANNAEASAEEAILAAAYVYETENNFLLANIPNTIDSIQTRGYYSVGDSGGHLKVRISTPSPVQPWHKQSADGAWWEMREAIPSIVMFGGNGNNIVNNSSAFQAADAYGKPILVTGGEFYTTYMPQGLYYGGGIIRFNFAQYITSRIGQDVGNLFSTVIGTGAGANMTGAYNTVVGYASGRNDLQGMRNTIIGHNLASGDTIEPETNAPFTGTDNVGMGYHAIKKMQSGSYNVGIGGDALNELKTGNWNTAIGQAAGQQIMATSDSTFVGGAAGGRSFDGQRNVFVGRNAGRENRSGSYNVTVGYGAGQGTIIPSTTATGNGVTTTFTVTGGYIFLTKKDIRVDIDGVNVLPSNYTVTGVNADVTLLTPPANGASIVFTPTIGSANNSYNSIMGYGAALNLRTGNGNSIFGAGAGANLTDGQNNVFLGYDTGNATNGSGNIFIGRYAGRSVTTAENRFIVANQGSLPFLDGTMGSPNDGGNRLTLDGYLQPAGDGARNLGRTSNRWSDTYTVRLRLTPGIGTTVTPTAAQNGELVIETTSNTQITFKLRGSDGVVRSGILTLS